jgi:hypothetical protein
MKINPVFRTRRFYIVLSTFTAAFIASCLIDHLLISRVSSPVVELLLMITTLILIYSLAIKLLIWTKIV